MGTLLAHIRLTRPANIITAMADILAGAAVSGAVFLLLEEGSRLFWGDLGWLLLATIGLYGGGVAFNDVFDAGLDRLERPERPIPSGQATVKSAAWMAFLLLLGGIVAAFQVDFTAGLLAVLVALFAVLYDAWGKHQRIFGPINMGLCRAGNLFLGMTLISDAIREYWYIGWVPLVYVAAITMVSRGEVHGKNKSALYGGLFLYVAVVVFIGTLAFLRENYWWETLPFLLLLTYFIFPPLVKALKSQEPALIGKSVKAAVLALILVNASLAAAFSGWWLALIILLLLPVSLLLARVFAVT